MDKKVAKLWLKTKYPVTIVCDRYSGTYSNGGWLAFPLDFDEIPPEVNDEDTFCQNFWNNYKEPVGKGRYPDDALDELEYLIKEIAKGN